MKKEEFTGDKKAPLVSPLAGVEKKFILANVGRFPGWIEGYHLTLMTILWSAGLIVFGYLAQSNIHWLWGSSLMIVLQWFTDCFDGALGRHRDTGIPLWGFYMDHFLDFVFMWCLFTQYLFIVHGYTVHLLYVLGFLYGILMVNSFLDFAATKSFKITYLYVGPTEIRVMFMILNMAIIYIGPKILGWVMTCLLMIFILGLAIIVYRTQKRIWKIDMENKMDN